MSQRNDYSKYDKLSPFELKDALIEVAKKNDKKHCGLLNAGRGNPNFLATLPREGFFQLGLFAMQEAELSYSYLPQGVGGFPIREGMMGRFNDFQCHHAGQQGIKILKHMISYVRDQMGLDANEVLYEMIQAILGCNYPEPSRMLTNSERIVKSYILCEMGTKSMTEDDLDLFAVEGGTAAMAYLFNSLQRNNLIKAGDKIAIAAPIFSPYLEIPILKDYNLVEVLVNADSTKGWQYSESELKKLEQPDIKLFVTVNPSNPPSVKIDNAGLKCLTEIIKKRKDLIVITDDVYGTFADNYQSLFAVCPKNTILVYSFSKYFGATGWRLGVIAMARDNLCDQMISKLPASLKKYQKQRYSSLTNDPEHLKFIDRLVADSRAIALNHTAGLSTPQQVQMVMFSLFELMDVHKEYKAIVKRIIRHRLAALYTQLGIPHQDNEDSVDYYTLLDIGPICKTLYGEKFAKWVLKTHNSTEVLFRIAAESGVILLPGEGFAVRQQSGRVSLANLNEYQYKAIGKAMRELIDEYYQEYHKK